MAPAADVLSRIHLDSVVSQTSGMSIQDFGASVARTGAYSLRLALDQLGLAPCCQMEEVLHQIPVHVPLCSAALAGEPDWQAIDGGYKSAVDWPTACFYRDLCIAYPSTRFMLAQRSPESWADGLRTTIYPLLADRHNACSDVGMAGDEQCRDRSTGVSCRSRPGGPDPVL